MYAANLQQIYSSNPNGKPFKGWIINISRDSKSEKDEYLHNQHRVLDITLSSQNVNYSEITTTLGKQKLYEKFGIQSKKHPLFLITNKYPEDCTQNDRLIVVEWGKSTDIEQFREDVMALAYQFNNPDFMDLLSKANNKKDWDKVLKYLKDNGPTIIKIGVSILLALL